MPKVNVKDMRRQQLMEANIASIAKHGLLETTITHVSESANMSRGIVNFYFTSKENMMLQTLKYLEEEYTALWQAALEQAHAQPPVDKIRTVLSAHFSSKLCTPKRLTVWSAFWGHATTHANYRKVIAASDERCKKIFSSLAQEIGQPTPQARLFGEELHAMIRGFWLSFLIAQDSPNRQKLDANCQAFVQRWFANAITEPVRLKPVSKPAPVKKPETEKAAPQLAFGDLFERKASQ